MRRRRPGQPQRRYTRGLGESEINPRPRTRSRSARPIPLLNPKQLADMLQVSPATVKRLVGDGRIPSVRVGTQHRFERHEVIRALKKPRKCEIDD